MSEPVVIDGWRCLIRDSGTRIVKFHGTSVWLAGDGHLCAEKSHGTLGFPHRLDAIPPAVLAWLIRPLLHDAWAACGTLVQRGVNYDNPHKDT